MLTIPVQQAVNHVQNIYALFINEDIAARVTQIVRSRNADWNGDLEFVFQTIDNLHKAVPNHPGDWYFSGNYLTAGGYRVVNQAYINYYESREGRAT